MGVTPTLSKRREKKSMDEYRSGWMGMRIWVWKVHHKEVHLCPIIKVKACKV